MSKAVMISIRPKWCEKIASGEKTIEVRKTRPKLETPFKCYIYCTQASVRYQTICGCHVLNSDELYRHPEQGIKHGDSIELKYLGYPAKKKQSKHGIGGLTMATKRVCDRCGAEINPFNAVTYAGMRRIKNDINDNDYELCVSCAHELRKWFNGEENDNG